MHITVLVVSPLDHRETQLYWIVPGTVWRNIQHVNTPTIEEVLNWFAVMKLDVVQENNVVCFPGQTLNKGTESLGVERCTWCRDVKRPVAGGTTCIRHGGNSWNDFPDKQSCADGRIAVSRCARATKCRRSASTAQTACSVGRRSFVAVGLCVGLCVGRCAASARAAAPPPTAASDAMFAAVRTWTWTCLP